MADKKEKKQSSSEAPESDNDLSPEEMEAMEKIMAEIDSGDDQPAQNDDQQENQSQEELTDDQQAALEKIMAEIDSGDSQPDSDSDQKNGEPQPGEQPQKDSPEIDVEAFAEQTEDDQESDDQIESELAKLVAQANSMTEQEPDDSKSPDDITSDSNLESAAQPANKQDETHSNHDQSIAKPEDELGQSDEKSKQNVQATGQAEANNGRQNETSKTDNQQVSFDAVYLDEVTPQQTTKAKGKQRKKVVKYTMIAAILTICSGLVITGLSYWRDYHKQPAIQPPASTAPVTEQVESMAADNRSEAVATDMPTENGAQEISPEPGQNRDEAGTPPPAGIASLPITADKKPTVPESEMLAEQISNLSELRQEFTAKKEEILSLQAYYRSKIIEKEKEIASLAAGKKIDSFAKAMANNKIGLGLKAIQRRKAYISKLDPPLKRLENADEQLLYYQRLAQIYRMMSGIISALPVSELEKDIKTIINQNKKILTSLADKNGDEKLTPLETIWKGVYARISEHRTLSGKTDKFNQTIREQVCNGDYDSMALMTRITPDAAKCLLNWPGKDLFLNDVTELSPEVAKILSQWPGEWLSLNGLESLSPEAAHFLAMWPGKRLSLNGLVELSDPATRQLSKWQGEQLEMIGLKKIGRWDNYTTKLYLSQTLRKKLEMTN